MEGNSLLLLSQLYRRGQGTCDGLLTLSHTLQVALNKSMEGRLVRLDFSSAFDRVSHRSLLYELRSIDVGRQTVLVLTVGVSKRQSAARAFEW